MTTQVRTSLIQGLRRAVCLRDGTNLTDVQILEWFLASETKWRSRRW